MPEENEKIEDFVSLWKKKIAGDVNSPSVLEEAINKVEILQKENEQLRKKIAENIELITRSESILKKTLEEKERLVIEKSEITQTPIEFSELEKENAELSNKVKSMVKLLLEKDEEIKRKTQEISQLQVKVLTLPKITQTSNIESSEKEREASNALIKDLQSDLSKKKAQISELEARVSELIKENEALLNQEVEQLKSLPIDYVIPVQTPESDVIKPLPPDTSSKPLELLCQDLQSDLNRYKKIIEKLNTEKSQLRQALENKGFQFNVEDLEALQKENEALKQDLEKIQKGFKEKSLKDSTTQKADIKLKELENKLLEKEDIIAQLKLSQPSQTTGTEGPMADLIENLQTSINKLKLTIQERDQEIISLRRKLSES